MTYQDQAFERIKFLRACGERISFNEYLDQPDMGNCVYLQGTFSLKDMVALLFAYDEEIGEAAVAAMATKGWKCL